MTGIYIASKTIHAPKWRALRDEGHPIISTWIDEAGIGETKSFPQLWMRCIGEASLCSALIVYREPDEVLKGGFIEVGAALGNDKHVYAIGCEAYSFVNHPNVYRCRSMESALAWANNMVAREMEIKRVCG